MMSNRFYQHRKLIDKLAKDMGYDADTASIVYAHRAGWDDYMTEYTEWRDLMRKYQTDKELTLNDLFSD